MDGALFINGEQEMAVGRVGGGTPGPKSIGSKVLKIKWWATSGPEWGDRSMSRCPEWGEGDSWVPLPIHVGGENFLTFIASEV